MRMRASFRGNVPVPTYIEAPQPHTDDFRDSVRQRQAIGPDRLEAGASGSTVDYAPLAVAPPRDSSARVAVATPLS